MWNFKYPGLLFVFLLAALTSGASAAIYVENASVLGLGLNTASAELNSSLNSIGPRIFTEDVDSLLGQDLMITPDGLKSSMNVVRPRIFTENLDTSFNKNLGAGPNSLDVSLAHIRPRIFTEHLDSIWKHDLIYLKGDLNDNGIPADAGDLVLMKRASIGEIISDFRYDLNENGIPADAGDLVLMKRASIGEISL